MTIQANQGFGVSIFGATSAGGGGSTSPGGSSGQLQYNASGSFGGMAGTSWDDTNRALTLTGATVTTSQPVLNLSQTWNAGAVTFTGLKFNATDTASASGSLLLDLQVGGASQFGVTKAGQLNLVNTASLSALTSIALKTGAGGTTILTVDSANLVTLNQNKLAFGGDAFITKPNAATFQLGNVDAAAPVAQTLQVQSVVAGTTNTAGANFTIAGSKGTGTGAGGSIIFQVAPAGTTGTAQNAYATALTISSSGTYRVTTEYDLKVKNNIQLTGTNAGISSDGARLILGDNSDVYAVAISGAANAGVTLKSAGVLSWTNGTAYGGTADVLLARDAANTLALRNGAATPQAFHVYNTYSSAADYERAALYWSGNSFNIDTLGAGTGATNRPLQVTAGGQLYLQAGSGYPISFGQKGIATYLTVGANGMLFGTDNTYDIGASGANRPRSLYVGTSTTIGKTGAGNAITANAPPLIVQQRMNSAGTAFTLATLNFEDQSSANTSKILDIQITGTSVASFVKNTNYNNTVLVIGPSVGGGSDPAISIARGVSTNGSGNAHGVTDATSINRTGTIGYNTYDAAPNFNGTVNYDHYAACQSRPTFQNTGTTTNHYGLYDQPSVATGATVTNRYGGYAADFTSTGTVTNNYGFYAEALAKGATTNWAFYAAGTTKSYFGGGITTGTPSGGTSGNWKVGIYNATAPAATGYVEVDIGGTLYKLLAAT